MSRKSIFIGKDIELIAVFTDSNGDLISLDAAPEVFIYDASVDSETIDSEIDSSTYSSAISGPNTATEIVPGVYSFVYTVPVDKENGLWTDVWTGEYEGAPIVDKLNFTVLDKVILKTSQLRKNEVVIVTLKKDIASLTGVTLGKNIQLSFLTELDPLYASVDLLYSLGGSFLSWIPDSTLALMLFWASRETDMVVPTNICDKKFLDYAKTQYVLYSTLYKAYTMPNSNSLLTGSKKTLGDLSISYSNGVANMTSSGIDASTIKQAKDLKDDWFKVILSGGCLNPGQAVLPDYGIPALWSPDRVFQGRKALDPSVYDYEVPTVNTKTRPPGHTRSKQWFKRRW